MNKAAAADRFIAETPGTTFYCSSNLYVVILLQVVSAAAAAFEATPLEEAGQIALVNKEGLLAAAAAADDAVA